MKNFRKLSMFHECSRSLLDGDVSLYALGDVFVLTIKGPSHLGSSLPRDSVLAVLMRTRSLSSNSLGMTLLLCHAFVYVWYLFSASRARTRSPSIRSLEVDSSTSGVAVELARGDPCFSSCGVIASDPYIKQKLVCPFAFLFVE